MFPVLFSAYNFSVSSFGVFATFGYLFAIFLIWRLSRAWEVDEEKILDISLLTFLGGLAGARIYFVIENWNLFASDFSKIILFYKLPGFSFWGGVLAGWLILFYLTKRLKLDFWQVADIASVGFLGGLIFGNIGCFLGGCGVGVPSKLFFAVSQVGSIGTRFPVQILEALLFGFLLIKIWGFATHFHLRGIIIAQALIFLSLIKLAMEPLKENGGENFFFLITLLILGFVIFYKVTNRSVILDIKNTALFPLKVVTQPKARNLLIDWIRKSWHNKITTFSWKLRNLKKLKGGH